MVKTNDYKYFRSLKNAETFCGVWIYSKYTPYLFSWLYKMVCYFIIFKHKCQKTNKSRKEKKEKKRTNMRSGAGPAHQEASLSSSSSCQ